MITKHHQLNLMTGAGKSTLLKTLACRSSGRRTGQVLYGGKKVVPKSFRMLTNVIPQDDILLNSLSPRDMITYTTRLRLGNLTELEQDYKIKSIIQELSLSSCADTVIGDVNNPGTE